MLKAERFRVGSLVQKRRQLQSRTVLYPEFALWINQMTGCVSLIHSQVKLYKIESLVENVIYSHLLILFIALVRPRSISYSLVVVRSSNLRSVRSHRSVFGMESMDETYMCVFDAWTAHFRGLCERCACLFRKSFGILLV